MSVQPPRDRYSDKADAGAETVGPYQLVSQVALGELAALYEAAPLSGPAPARPLLVKRLVPKHARNPEYQAALRREAELSASLLSSDIVRTLNIESTPDLYSVMERIDGANLAVLLAQARQHDLETTRFAVPLIVGALRALDYLHRGHDPTGGAFLVHQAPVARHIMGDIEGRAHIIDLTLAMGPALPRSALTDHRLRPYEMAPEQALAPHTVDPRCDIFIVGMTLWETLTGQRLFAGRSPIEAQKKMLSSSIVPPSETGTGAHHCFDRLCMRALARTRGTRFPNAGEMAAELQDEAVRAGLYAEPQELAAWVESTIALARRPAPVAQHTLAQTTGYTEGYTQPRDTGKQGAVATRTMMGIGGPDAEVLRIAEAYRESESLKQTRNFRRPRTNGASRSSTPPSGASDLRSRAGEDPAASTRRAARDNTRSGRGSVAADTRDSALARAEAGLSVVGSAEPEPHRSSFTERPAAPTGALPELGRPGMGPVTQLGLAVDEEWLVKPPSKRPGLVTLGVAGIVTAGLLALLVRGLPGGDTKPYSFGAAPVAPQPSSPPLATGEAPAQAPTSEAAIAPPAVSADLGAAPAAEPAGAPAPAPFAPALDDALRPITGPTVSEPAKAASAPDVVEPLAPAGQPTLPVEAVRSNTNAGKHATRGAGGARPPDSKRVSSTPAAAPAPVVPDVPAAVPGDAAPTAAAASTATPRWEAPSTLQAAEPSPAAAAGAQPSAKWVAPRAHAKPAGTPDAPRWGNPPASASGASGLPDNPF